MSIPGIIRQHPNFRDAPNLDSNVIHVLDPGTRVEIIGLVNDYFGVLVDGRGGFIHKDFVVPDANASSAPQLDLRTMPAPPTAEAGSLAAEASFAVVALSPPQGQVLAGDNSLARVWNQNGGLITALSGTLGVDPAVAVATLAVESGGRSAGQDGRMLIRFENHIFYQYWGTQNEATFRQHFTFDADQKWLGHQWRPTPDEAWRACHVDDQDVEWEAFEFARVLDDTAAKLSISMGLTQVMGFNHSTLGYSTPQAMFDAFSRGPRYQVIGFFDFVRRNGAVSALQSNDYATFARIYNGTGQVDSYTRMIRESVDEFRRLRQN